MREVRYYLIICLFLSLVTLLSAQNSNFSIDLNPKISIPMRTSADLYSIGGGAVLSGTYDPSLPYYIKGGIGYELIPTLATENMNLITGSIGGGLRLDIGDFITYRLGAYGGAYLVSYDDITAWNPYGGAETGLQFNITKSIQVSLMGSYDYYVGEILTTPSISEESFFEGVSAFIGISFNPGAISGSGIRRPRMEIFPPSFNSIFPVFYQYYNDNTLGSVIIRNDEKNTITDVKVSFFVNQFMEAPKLSAVIDELKSGEEVEIPLYGLFKDSVLGVTEVTTVTAQIFVEYNEDEDILNTSFSESIKILNRNNMTWDDDRKAAAFVTANDPTVLRFARNIASSIRSDRKTAVNENLRNAMAIFQALNIFGMRYVIDPDSSYIELSENEKFLDFLQFPQQTLDYRTGDCDDLSILYSALLESVGIRTAFITIPGHIYMAFALDMDEKKAIKTFSQPNNLIIVDDEAWVPVEITMMKDDFLSAWKTGAKQWRENNPVGLAGMYKIRDAWKTYSPTGFASTALDVNVPQTTEVLPNYLKILNTFIKQEIGPRVIDLKKRIIASNNNPRVINSLGILYARYGLYDEASEQFNLAVKTDEYLPSLINLGNIAFLNKETEIARGYLERARVVRDDHPKVLVKLARIHFDLEEYKKATKRYREAEVIDPEIVQAYSYIVNENKDSARASAAQERNIVSWDEE
ncbi:MAG: hypothetical protein OCD02_09240 [Spirochaetaceae bacterium]